ncbi:MAG TPA: hypothetical protein VNV43_15025 [Candidatus Acidoferrales bacterium]|nr:hypothetical protein [Candidatus Acidoferrales bacterium]
MAIENLMFQLYGKPIFTIDGTDDDLNTPGASGAFRIRIHSCRF